MIKNGIVAICVAVFLSGCSAAPKRFLFEGKKADSETATLVGLSWKGFENADRFDAEFYIIDEHHLNDFVLGNPREVDVLPGKHTGTVRCSGYNKSAVVPVFFEVVASNKYEFDCVDLRNGKVMVEINDKGRK